MTESEQLQRDWDLWRHGDAVAGDRLFRALRKVLLRYFGSRCPEQAEDLTQQTILACVQARDRFRGDSRVTTFVLCIARRVLYPNRARQRIETKFHRASDEPDELCGAASLALLPELRAVRHHVARLPESYRDAMERYHFMGHTGTRLARDLDLPVATVRSRLHRGLNLLRRDMGVPGHGLGQARRLAS
ncbi:MAG: sigma-70 family RNA polymerase sigma factor [Myxococcota bacterium]